MTARTLLLTFLLAIVGLLVGLSLENWRQQFLPSTPEMPDTTGSVVVGQGPPGDPCTVEINAEVYPKLKEMGIERWAEACREARATTIE